MPEKGQIFVGGLPRSGTSLMRIIIGNHPDVAMFYEDLPLWGRFYRNYKNKNFENEAYQSELINEITSHRIVQLSQLKPRKSEILKTLKRESNVDCMRVFFYLLKDYAEQTAKTRFGIKVPLSEFYAEDIFKAFPESKMIHMIRDVRDVALSYKNAGMGKRQYSLLHHIRLWKNSTKQALILQEKYPERFMLIRYEDLVEEPEKIIKNICEFTELEYIPDILQMKEQEAWTGQNSSFQTTIESRSKINKSAIGRHKTMLGDANIWVYQLYLKPLMDTFGYSLHPYSNTIALRGYLKILSNTPAFLSIITMQGIAALIRGSFLYKTTKTIYQKLNIPDYLG